jgi:hypothetical protein
MESKKSKYGVTHPILVKYGVAFFSLMHGIPPHFKQQIWGWQLSKVKWGGNFFTTNSLSNMG